MNKRLQKKTEKRRRQEIHKVLDLVLDINGLDKRDRDFSGNLPTAFFNFSGHVAGISVRIDRKGWYYGKRRSEVSFDTYLSKRREIRNLIDALEEEKDPGDGNLQRSAI